MRLLTAHRILVISWLALSLVMLAWAITQRRQEGAVWLGLLGGLGLPVGALYLRQLYRHPPLR